MDLFRGYVPTKDKHCLKKFKDAPLMSHEGVEGLDEYAGVLAEDVVLIDIDDMEQSEILMRIVEDRQLDCRVYRTTRGRHFLFLNGGKVKQCSTGVYLACGLKADIKAGIKNSYEVLKIGGKKRPIEWDIEADYKDGYQVLPNFLLPIPKYEVNLLALGDGEGRNSALFEHILTLSRIGLGKEEARDVLEIINKYIFKTPLAEKELETISRDEAFPSEVFYDAKKGFQHDAFGNFLIAEKHIARINGQLHIYKNGVYVAGIRDIEAAMLEYIPNLKANQRTEAMKYIELVAPEKRIADARYVAFNNGIYDIATGALLPFTCEMAITNRIPWDYKADAYSETCDKVLDKIACHDSEIRRLLEECIGYCFYRRNEMSKAFILTGEKSNGKSTYLDMVKNVLGEDNISSLDLAELDERFSVAEMAGKLANIGDDISDEFMQGRSVATFKKIVSGNSVKAEFKGQDVFFFAPYVKLLFSANSIPRTKDKTGAVLRRLVIIPFNAIFSETDPDYDPYIIYKLRNREAMEYLARLAIEGLRRVVENRRFSNSSKVEGAVKEYETENNPILSFLDEVGIAEIEGHVTDDVYRRYKLFCYENGYSEMTKNTFSKDLIRKLNFTTKLNRLDGKVYRIYIRK